MSYDIKTFTYGSPEYQAALALRTEILRKPLGLMFTPEELKKDEADVHFGLFEGSKIIACLTLTNAGDKKMKMRQVAVQTDQQGKGVGRDLSNAAEDYARKQSFVLMFCHARKTAAPFYQKLGYQVVGDEFTEVNIPHYVMEKQL